MKPKKEVSIDKVDASTSEVDDGDDYNRKRITHFTPGRIRAAKHDPDKVNNYMSPGNTNRTPERRQRKNT